MCNLGEGGGEGGGSSTHMYAHIRTFYLDSTYGFNKRRTRVNRKMSESKCVCCY